MTSPMEQHIDGSILDVCGVAWTHLMPIGDNAFARAVQSRAKALRSVHTPADPQDPGCGYIHTDPVVSAFNNFI